MKVAMIGQKGIPATYGGIERHVEEVGTRLAARGHEVAVYCRYYYTRMKDKYRGVKLIRLPSIRTKHLDTATHCAVSTLDAMVRGFDVVHFHALGPSLFSALPRLAGAKTVVTIHGLDWQREKWGPAASWVLKRCEYPAVSFPTRTVVVSRTLQEYFREKYGVESVVIPNGTNIPTPRPLSRLKKKGLEPRKYILFVGRLVPEKGCHYLIEAYQKLETDAKLVIAGGSSFSSEYVESLKRHASDRVLLLDYVYGDDLEELWSNALLVALPSTLEGLSISLLEALSYGKCVLVSDIAENLEVVEDCAPSFRSKDVGDLRRKLEELLAAPDVLASYEERAKQHILQRFTWDGVTKSLEQLYVELLSK
ncbi:MAG: glycosyltransferase family 4 protein [Candidatus Eiseniibacteriota bacterium]|nr:MAG: glycosyltransferase family 4 protein [Candidatus Eisenbacteria bacterium]